MCWQLHGQRNQPANENDLLDYDIGVDLGIGSNTREETIMSLNVSKTNYITMQNTNEIYINHTLKIWDETIKQVNTAKFLGIIIDDKLSWNAHIDYCKNKLSSGLYAINSAKHILSPKHLKSLYYTLKHPHLTYGLLLWGSTYKTQKITLFKINLCEVLPNQNIMHPLDQFMKILVYYKYPNYINWKLPNLCFSIKTNIFPHHSKPYSHPILTYIITTPDIEMILTSVSTRRTNQLSRSFIHNAHNIWYNILLQIKETRTVGSFCHKMKRYLSSEIWCTYTGKCYVSHVW